MNRWNKRFWSKWSAFPAWACFDGGGGDPPKDPPKNDPPKNVDGGGKEPGKGDPSKNEPFAVFPDAASFNARMERATRSQLEAMAKDLGFDSVDAMKAAAKAKKEADDKNKSDLEKEKEAREKAEREKKDALEAANARLINADIKVFAAQAGFADPSDAVALVDRTDIKVDDATGEVTGAKEAVEALAKAKPHLLGKGAGGGGNIGGSANPGSGGGGSDEAGKYGAELGKKQQDQFKKQQDSQNLYFK